MPDVLGEEIHPKLTSLMDSLSLRCVWVSQLTVNPVNCRHVFAVLQSSVIQSNRDIVFPSQLTFSESPALSAATASEFEVEPVQGRKVSKVVKTTVVRGERMEKHTGDPSLAADLPSAREDFEKVSKISARE